MELSIYVDGSGGGNSGYGYFVKETGESFYEKNHQLLIIRLNILQ